MKYKRIWIILISVLVAALAALCGVIWNDYNAISQGVSASIIASLLFWIFTDVIQVSSERDYLSKIIIRMENLEQSKSDGLVDIHKRRDADKFWIDFANNAEDKLVISGTTLHKWIASDESKKALANAIKRIAKKRINFERYNEPIILIIFSDLGINLESERRGGNNRWLLRDDLNREKIAFCKYLADIIRDFNPIERSSIVMYETDRFPYMYCNNGKYCIVGTYFDNRSDTMNLQLIFRNGIGDYEREYTEDIYNITKNLPVRSLSSL